MEIVIELAANELDQAAIRRVRQEVFAREMGLALPPLATTDAALHLLARAQISGAVVAALSVIETSGDDALHRRYGLDFPSGARVARYTQMAVLRPFRGLSLPLRLILEAHRRFVAPGLFDYTWLLFDAERAASSQLCRQLAFTPSAQIWATEYGRSRTLVRDEAAPPARAAMRRAAEFVAATMACAAPATARLAPARGRAGVAV